MWEEAKTFETAKNKELWALAHTPGTPVGNHCSRQWRSNFMMYYKLKSFIKSYVSCYKFWICRTVSFYGFATKAGSVRIVSFLEVPSFIVFPSNAGCCKCVKASIIMLFFKAANKNGKKANKQTVVFFTSTFDDNNCGSRTFQFC